MAAKENISESAQDIEALFELERIETAVAWRPEDEDWFIGTVIDRRIGPDNGFGTYPLITYRIDNGGNKGLPVGGYVAYHAFHTQARDMLKEIGIAKGAQHYLKYKGMRPLNNPTEDQVKKGNDKYHLVYGRDTSATDVENGDAFKEAFGF